MGGAREVLVTECPYPSVPVPVILSLPLPLSPYPYRKGLGTKLLISYIMIRPFLSVKDVACKTTVGNGNATSLVDSFITQVQG